MSCYDQPFEDVSRKLNRLKSTLITEKPRKRQEKDENCICRQNSSAIRHCLIYLTTTSS